MKKKLKAKQPYRFWAVLDQIGQVIITPDNGRVWITTGLQDAKRWQRECKLNSDVKEVEIYVVD